MARQKTFRFFLLLLLIPLLLNFNFGQRKESDQTRQAKVRTMTIPISIYTKDELKEDQAREFVEAGNIFVEEDEERQIILSIRSVRNTPLSLAVLIQDDLTGNINLQLSEIKRFIRSLPSGSRVMVAYLRGGKTQIRQKFTTDLDAAADSIRIVIGSSAVAPRNPYDGVIDMLKRFDALPTGRRAILLVSDGLDITNGLSSLSPSDSPDLDRAILQAQRKGVAVYSFYTPASITRNADAGIILKAQSSLNRISEETGGRAFFQGTFSPISFQPFFKDLNLLLNRQFALTYLSTHMDKGYHKVRVMSTNPEIEIDHPKGYYYRR